MMVSDEYLRAEMPLMQQMHDDILKIKGFIRENESNAIDDNWFMTIGIMHAYHILREKTNPSRDIEQAWRRLCIGTECYWEAYGD